MFCVPTCAVFFSLLVVVRGDGYGHGIAKKTLSGSDPVAFFAFMARFLPVQCQDQGTPCHTTFACGAAGRAALCRDENCSYSAESPPTSFGIHFANLSARPYGEMDNVQVEKHFTDKFHVAFLRSSYDSFLDFGLVLYAASLDRYVSALREDNVPFILMQWKDDAGQPWYSMLFQVATSQLILELVSPVRPASVVSEGILNDTVQRLPASVFVANNVSSVSLAILTPLAVSMATSDLRKITNFYTQEMFASVAHTYTSSNNAIHLKSFSLHGANALVRFVERPASATHGQFKVSDLEKVQVDAHEMAHTDAFCGVSKWYDNHYAYDQDWAALDAFKAAFDRHGRKYHIFGDCKPSTKPGPGTNLNVFDPMGNSIQLDPLKAWVHCPIGGSGDALQNPCSQGNCSKYQPSTSCTSELLSRCSSYKGNATACSDCVYPHWKALQKGGCRNADAINFCTPTSPEVATRTSVLV